MTLREVLHAHVPVLSPSSTVRDAVDKMDVYQFPALVVVDADGAPVAVVTEGDVCRAAAHHGNLVDLADETAAVHGTPSPTVASADTEIADALAAMTSSGITVLPVVEGDRFVGFVLRVDLMHAMLLDTVPAD